MVYLLHFYSRINPDRPCQHYIGYAEDALERLKEHRAGRGARLTQVANERNIGYEIVRIWTGNRKFERRIKNRKNSRHLCPICSEKISLVSF